MAAIASPSGLSPLRLNLLRLAYLVLIVGLGVFVWPTILDGGQTFALKAGVVAAMLGAMSALALFGLRQPLQMLPILLFEIAWKAIWLARFALPKWLAGDLDEATAATALECLPVILIAAVIPWGHVWRTYTFGRDF